MIYLTFSQKHFIEENNYMGCVYICHHVDTEGPLDEKISDLFSRLKLIFGIHMEPTEENLKKIQAGNIELDDDKKKQLLLAVDQHTIGFKNNWRNIEVMLMDIMSKKFRDKMLDSFGGGWIYNWNIMDHVGFVENPRKRDIGYLKIFNFYENMMKTTNSSMDALHWHFHPIPFYKQANIPATSYDNSMHELHQVILRRLIEKNWFPRVNRAGFHTERIDSNFFLEQWIPFDPSNQSVNEDYHPNYQKDLTEGRFGDWRGAPTDWSMYNPSFYDWRMKGNCNRTIARVLNMKSRHRSINVYEIEKAFKRANNQEDVYLGVTNHDWREMSTEIDEFRLMLKKVINKYPKVHFKFSESVHAFREILGYGNDEVKKNKITFEIELINNLLLLQVTNGELFGPQPYLALKTATGEYFHDNFDFNEFKKSYSYTFDEYTLKLNELSNLAIASNDKYGNSYILNLKFKNGKIVSKKITEIN